MRAREKASQEKVLLLGINDSFKKGVLVRDVVKLLRDEWGVATMSVPDFSLDESTLGPKSCETSFTGAGRMPARKLECGHGLFAPRRALVGAWGSGPSENTWLM